MRKPTLTLLTVFLTCPLAFAADRPEGRSFATRSVTVARHGMVAAEHPLAVQVGVEVLRRGGSAVDAAIAVNAALGLMEPTSCGLGGDLFAMVWAGTAGADSGQGPTPPGRYDTGLLPVRVDSAGLR
jgi:gamma-glutamyltranspeptidase/glutathione hydrolase